MELSDTLFPMEFLPAPAVEVIAKYLSIKDLASCCAVNRGVRELFDDELVWKPRCQKGLAKYLLKTPCKVKPEFTSPEIPGSELTPISEWRLAFMAENHLWNNWRRGAFVKEKIDDLINITSHEHSLFHKFHTNDTVMAIFKNMIKILDVSKFPAVSLVPPIPKFSMNCHHESVNTAVVSICSTCVQVYDLNFIDKKWSIKHTFYFDKSQKQIFKTSDEALKEFEKHCKNYHENYNTKFCLTGHYFVGFFDEDSSIHIWNIETGVKLKKEQYTVRNAAIKEFQSTSANDLIICVKERGKTTTTCFSYSLSKLIFLPFRFELKHFKIGFVFKDYVGIIIEDTLTIFNYQTSEKVESFLSKTYDHNILRNQLVFICHDSLKWFNINTRQLETLLTGVSGIEVLTDKFVQVQMGYVWKMMEVDESLKKLKEISMDFSFKTCVFFLNKTFCRYIVRYEDGYLLNFW